MRLTRSVSLAGLVSSFAVAGLLVGCSSGGAVEDPGAFKEGEVTGPLSSDPELAEIEVGADELVARPDPAGPGPAAAWRTRSRSTRSRLLTGCDENGFASPPPSPVDY